ncbi:Inositol polyphosphate multikinase [Candida viswanathii]|uniref:Kinase n=1 Tax=Candida viswanathii TaxID=5486 RepID=A0A367XP06_9ASCO|nr:Inositol polyphosphate multikinase [Candida viswanathii]
MKPPASFAPSKHQAAGHDGCLTSESLFIKLTGQQEIDFYAETQQKDQLKDAALGSALSHWMPTYMGTLTQGDITKEEQSAEAPASDKQYIVLLNSYHGFNHPSILDIKLGSKLTDDAVTSQEKIERLQKVSDSTTSGSLSFRICGMKVYNGTSGKKPEVELYEKMNDSSVSVNINDNDDHKYLEFNKFYGRSLTKSNIKEGLALFFNNHLPKDVERRLLSNFHKRLQLLYNCLLDYEIRIFSGSLLFIYESDLSKWAKVMDDNYELFDPLVREFEDDEDDDDEEKDTFIPLSSLNFIDFAHAKYVPGQGHDENVIQGVENLIEIFESLLQEHSD